MRAILIDDEKNALDVLEMQLNHYCPSVTIVAKCAGGEEGVLAIRQHRPELVFLDIEMPRVNGFDVLAQTNHIAYDVIFTTAYDQFALKAFIAADGDGGTVGGSEVAALAFHHFVYMVDVDQMALVYSKET